MEEAAYALTATIGISLISLIGLFALSLKEGALDEILFYLISFASGTILGAALFDLVPEAAGLIDIDSAIPCVALGFASFYFLERSIYWYHGHGHARGCWEMVEISEPDRRAGTRGFVYLNVIGDAVHNLIDGMIIGASFAVSFPAGLVSTLAVAFHELPQEIGDFSILVYGGLGRGRALAMNFLTALVAILGALSVLSAPPSTQFLGSLMGFAGGGFIYLSAAELLPELKTEGDRAKSLLQYALFASAMLLVWILTKALPG